MTQGTPSGYGLAVSIQQGVGSFSTFDVDVGAVVNDGVSMSMEFGFCYTYDTTQTPAANIAALKASFASFAQTFGFTVSPSNILILMAVN